MMPKAIVQFTGAFRFLSNFYPAIVEYEGVRYPTSEHAYQAAKSADIIVRRRVADCGGPGDAKRVGRALILRPDWEQVKNQVMLDILRSKFSEQGLRARLDATGDMHLEEGNTWGDTYWGVCNGVGQNWLGKTLMHVREENRRLRPIGVAF